MVVTVSQAVGVHLVQVPHCMVGVHSLGIHPLEDTQLAPEEGRTLLLAQPWGTVTQGVEHKGPEEVHRDQEFPEE